MACVDVDDFRGGGSGTGRWRWEASVCFVGERGSGNVVEVKEVILLRGVVPLDMRELTVITHVLIGDAAFQQEVGNVGVVGLVWLCGVVVHP